MNLALDPSSHSALVPALEPWGVGRYDDPRLEQIRSRVAPVVLAHEQTMPIVAALDELFAERALVRGRTLACTGPAATSVAMEMVAAAVVAGSWLAVVDVPTFGLDAACEAGIPLERVVAVTTQSDVNCMAWVEVMAAAVDGFDVVVARQPDAQTSAAALRKLSTRIRQRGAVVVMLDDRDWNIDRNIDRASNEMSAGMSDGMSDGVIDSATVSWSGLGAGYGHLEARTVDLSVSGRRFPGRQRCRVTLPRPSHQNHHMEHGVDVTLTATPAPLFGSARDDVA